MRKIWLIAVISLAVVSTGCTDASIRKMDQEQIEDIKNKIVYFKDHKGICWGTVQSGKLGGSSSGIMGGVVPCDQVGLGDNKNKPQ